jgi:hypothetical protein
MLPLQLVQFLRQRTLDGGLYHRIECGEDIQPLGTQILVAIVALELATHQRDEVGIVPGWTPAAVLDPERRTFGPVLPRLD